MPKKFQKMQADDFSSLLDSISSSIPDDNETEQKPITEKSIKNIKNQGAPKKEKPSKQVEQEPDDGIPIDELNMFGGLGGELAVSEEPEPIPEPAIEKPVARQEKSTKKPETKPAQKQKAPVKKQEVVSEPKKEVKADKNEAQKQAKVEEVKSKPVVLKKPVVSEEISENVVVENLSDFASTHTKDELNDYGKKRLSEISYNDTMVETLFPLVCQDLHGYKGVFVGSKGGLKDEFMGNLSMLLFELGKISSPKYESIAFSNMPEKFTTDKLYFIKDLNDAIINLFNLDDLSESSSVTQHEYRNKLERLIKSPGYAYVILDVVESELKGFLTLDARLPFLFGRKVFFENLSNEAIAQRFVDALPDYHKRLVTDDFMQETVGYLERNRRYFPFDNQELADYLANYTSRFESLEFPKEKYNPNTLEESFKSIVGMAVVKKQISELNEYLQIRQRLEKAGIKLPPFNLHMMFLGNPGVGKTTIARIISKVLFDLGYIREEKLVEVTSKDLVSAYGSQTGVKTNKVIMSALGGVLFVDEAYSLAKSNGTAGLEAITNIVKAMEDYKNDLVVMFAGYSLEMQEFVRSNSGIASRISYVFEFSDYTDEELFQIFEIKLKQTGMILDQSAIEPIMKLCKFAAGRRNFGNGRFIDKLLQRALTKHATLELTPSEMLVLRKDSIPEVEEVMASFGRFNA